MRIRLSLQGLCEVFGLGGLSPSGTGDMDLAVASDVRIEALRLMGFRGFRV